MFLKRPTRPSPEDRETLALARKMANQIIREKRARTSVRLPMNELVTLLTLAAHGGRRLERDRLLGFVASQLSNDERRTLMIAAQSIFGNDAR